jgi:SAM-dependent methyltransferase
MHVKHRQTCRVCGSRHLTPVIDLGEQHLQGSFIKPGRPLPSQRKLPTLLVRCDVTKDENGCGLLQLGHSFPTEVLYANYWYRSGVNETMRNHLKGIAAKATELISGDDLRVLDIGCNDGTLLRCYPDSFERIGVDPSDIAAEIAPPIRVVNTAFPSDSAATGLADRKVDIVTSIAMFYDLDDPVEFARSVKSILAPTGIWILEMSYLPAMLKQNAMDTICHEHQEYYSLAVLEFIMRRAGLRVFAAELNDINGGSVRCYVTHGGCEQYDTPSTRAFLTQLRLSEFELGLDADEPYAAFQARILALRGELRSLLVSLKHEGKRVHVYGASTKGNVLLQWCGIDRGLVECAADRNPAKHGARTIGTEIPIIAEEESRAMKPDYYLVLPWHFRDEFLRRERPTIMAGTKMIFPLPKLEIVGKAELDAARGAAMSAGAPGPREQVLGVGAPR